MTLYELDAPDRDELIEILYFSLTSAALSSCDYDGCPERKSGWGDMASSTSSAAVVEAQLRMKAFARIYGACDWHWGY